MPIPAEHPVLTDGVVTLRAPRPDDIEADREHSAVEQRLLALATVIATAKIRCTLPARSALYVDEGFWVVDCVEGTYTLILTNDSRIITGGGAKAADLPPN